MDRTDGVASDGGSPPVARVSKRCTKCGIDKPLTAYNKQPGGRLGLHPTCRECRRAAERSRYRVKREEILAKQKAKWPQKKEQDRRRRRLVRYGVTQEQYDEMYSAQDGCCAICGERFEVLCVDHDHETGEVRGLLCWPCNIGIGHLRDDPGRLIAAARYLRRRSIRPR